MGNKPEQPDSRQRLKRALLAIEKIQSRLDSVERAKKEPIAIIGMGCRFPGNVENPEEFWKLLHNGTDAVTEVPPDRWDIDAYYNPDPDTPGKMNSRHGGFISKARDFEPDFFGISPREALSLDPQQRLLLEVTWEALENAGIVPDHLAGTQAGVFIGVSTNDYLHLLLERENTDIDAYLGTGNARSVVSGRISYILGIQGPNFPVDTACSSSLVAVHLACHSLRRGESSLAMAGGVNLIFSPEITINFSKARMLAPDGRCKTFDESADGYVRGEGAGVIVLKRLSDALADRDNIIAVIRGTAVNQDGRSSSLTVPNGPSQQAVIRRALEDGDIKPDHVSYVEGHGTGTALGDPIEIGALNAVFGRGRPADNPLFIGSVKTNFGHLEAAAGIAGLIKTVLSLQNNEIPPHLHFNRPNPEMPWDKMPLTVATKHTPWLPGETPRIAGVSSFGFSGTNAHIVISDFDRPTDRPTGFPKPRRSADDDIKPSILTLSAKTEESLKSLAGRYENYLSSNPDSDLEDICFTANVCRSHFTHRLSITAESQQQALEKISGFAGGEMLPGVLTGQASEQPKTAFLLTGQGAQYIGMGRELYETQPVFRQTLDLCDEILRPYLEKPLLEVLYPGRGASGLHSHAERGNEVDPRAKSQEPTTNLLDETAYTQPALFAVEYALAELLKSWGIKPDIVMGHSVGEYTAACLAGVFSLEHGLKLIAGRGRLMQSLPRDGEMTAVFAGEARVADAVRDFSEQVSVAAVNGPELTVISGKTGAVREVAELLESQGIKNKKLNVSHAFHSPLMEPILDEFEKIAGDITFSAPKINLISNLTGKLATDEIATPGYWRRHILMPVRFADSIKNLFQQDYKIFVEIGPKPVLLGMARQCITGKETDKETGFFQKTRFLKFLPSLRQGKSDQSQLLQCLGELYVHGTKIDWPEFCSSENRRRLVLPTYPFKRQEYWFDADKNKKTSHTGKEQDMHQTRIFSLLNQGDTDKLVQELETDGQFSEHETKLVHGIVRQFVEKHQKQLTASAVSDWFYQLKWQQSPKSEIDNQQSTIDNRQSTIDNRQSTISNRQSTIDNQQSTIDNRQSTIDNQQSTIDNRQSTIDNPGSWLIFADKNGLGQTLAEQLEEHGQKCFLAYAGDTYEKNETGTWNLNPASPDNFEHFLRDIREINNTPLKGIIHLWSLDTLNSDELTISDLENAQLLGCGSVLHLIQALIKHDSPSLKIVTRGAVPIENTSLSLPQASLWGLGKVIALEHPSLWEGMVDLSPENDDTDMLLSEIINPTEEDHVAFRNKTRYTARLRKLKNDPTTSHFSLPTSHSYLITGGLGALGIRLAEWLAEHGAEHLILTGRSGASTSRSREAVEQLEKAGAKVIVAKADVADEKDAAGLVEDIRNSFPPLRGIIHAAGILDDGVLSEQNWERFTQVMSPKIKGTWNLHTMTKDIPLDFFICFSSAASLLGSPGQGNYAAANAFMDAFAHYRRGLGLPCLSINWGPWDDGGMATGMDSRHKARMIARGMTPIEPEKGLQALEQVLNTDLIQAGILPADWTVLKKQFYGVADSSLLSELLPESETRDKTEQQSSALLEKLLKTPPAQRRNILIGYVREEAASVLGLDSSGLPDPKQGFFDMGMDSLMAVELKNRLEAGVKISLPATLLFESSTANDLADYLIREVPDLKTENKTGNQVSSFKFQVSTDIAVIGMGCRFPGADNPESFWTMLRNGKDAVSEIPSDRWNIDEYYNPDPNAPGKMYTRYGAFLQNVDQFDPQFFGISPREAASLDPQQRMLLEVGWEALENAGQAPDKLSGTRTGIFVGIGQNDYAKYHMMSGKPDDINFYTGTGSGFCFASGRLSFVLGLQGPNMAIDTACSSSLVSVHLASQSLRTGECDLALAGGVHLILSPEVTIFLSKAKALSPDGRCKTFDASADGFGRGEGCGIIVLKRLSDAISDHDNILAVIKGSAVNHDGPTSGFTVPNGLAQQAIISQALANADIQPSQVNYVEAHGTGTFLGDPIEIRSSASVLGQGRSPEQPLMIGSVKTNVGHLEAAAGIAGLIKTLLSLRHEEIPPHLHFKQPNPNISWDDLPVSVPTEPTPWPSGDDPRIAGISAFGISGTNAHVVISDYKFPISDAADPKSPFEGANQSSIINPQSSIINHQSSIINPQSSILTLSAKTEDALRQLAGEYEHWLSANPDMPTEDICFTANAGRSHFAHRLCIIAGSSDELRNKLAAFASGQEHPEIFRGKVPDTNQPDTAFLFKGNDAHHNGAGSELYETQPVFRQTIDQCNEILKDYLEKPLLEVLYPGRGASGLHSHAERGNEADGVGERGNGIGIEPALFAIEYALAELWQSWGIEPAVVAGDGVGEYAAACAAGVFSLEDGIKLSAEHKKLEDFQNLQDLTLHSPRTGFISCLTGKPASDEITLPEYWMHREKQPMNGNPAEILLQQGYEQIIEIDPDHEKSGWHNLLKTLGKLYVSGVNVDWQSFYQYNSYRKTTLPTYPFQKQRYWVETAETGQKPGQENIQTPIVNFLHRGDTDQLTQLLEKTGNLSEDKIKLLPELLELLTEQHQKHLRSDAVKDLLYQVEWQLIENPDPTIDNHQSTIDNRQSTIDSHQSSIDNPGLWLIFADQSGLGQRLSELLEESGQNTFLAYAENGHETRPQTYAVNPANSDDFEHFVQNALDASDYPLKGIIHLWSLDADYPDNLTVRNLSKSQISNCASVLHLIQALVKKYNSSITSKLWLITRGAVPVQVSNLALAQTPLWGLGKVISLEHPELWGGLIDLSPRKYGNCFSQEAAMLLSKIQNTDDEDHIVFRDGQYFTPRLVRMGTTSTASSSKVITPESTYIITGGLGSLGLRTACHLAEKGATRLVLTGRKGISSKGAQDTVKKLEDSGVHVIIAKADVADKEDMTRVFEQIRASAPPLRGIIHAAGIPGYQDITEMNMQSLDSALQAKVSGAWILHQLTQETELDFMVYFSSIASVWGSRGQAHYAAANYFLDMMAHYRNQLGLPGMSINWGPWADGGMATTEARKWLTRRGVDVLQPEKAMDVLERLFDLECTQATAADVDWATFKSVYELRGRRPLLEHIKVELMHKKSDFSDFSNGEQPEILQQLEKASPGRRRDMLTAYLQKQVAAVLDFDTLPAPGQGFFDMGMDSLTAVELKEQLEAELGVSLPSTLAFDCPSIKELAFYITRDVMNWELPTNDTDIYQDNEKQISASEEAEHIPEDELEESIAEKLARLEALVGN
ncbi:MAG: SDR family NAD(P)-dependent oxidoreductase [Desulfobacterales bacterium]|nr:SDR family NAD(P)-dependent oxidoreductase [Desulfobacterales bacterium]